MSRTPRRSPAAIPPRVPTAGASVSPSPGPGRPRTATPRRTRPADNRPAGRASGPLARPPAPGSLRSGSGTTTPSSAAPEHRGGGAPGTAPGRRAPVPAGTAPARQGGAPADTARSTPGRGPHGTAADNRTRMPSETPPGSRGRVSAAGHAPLGRGPAPVAAPRPGHGAAPTGSAPAARLTAPAGTAPMCPGGAPRGVPQPRPTDRFAEMLVAVLSGQRPVHAMLRHSAGQAYDELIRLAERGPLRTRGARPVVRDIGWFVPREGAIEAFARIGAGDRLRAMAFRLERGRDLRWRCTAVELGGPR
ncbi:Rv3235 family protein [Streptomyces althioticus]